MSNLFWVSAAQVYKEHGAGPHSAANLLAWYGWTFTRGDATTCATWFDQDGILQTASTGTLRMEWDNTAHEWGFVIERPATNVALWNRDLTNAAWVKTGGGGVSAVKDQIGIDGVASSASRITASGANGTCLQTVTLGSSGRLQSCYIKRLVGSGNIDMTTDGGSTWTTVAVTTAWTRVSIPLQTVTNPVFGFRIVTNADSVAIDFVQNESVTAFPTHPIATTTASVPRNGDVLLVPFSNAPQDTTILTRGPRPVYADNPTSPALGADPYLYTIGNDVSNIFSNYYDHATRTLFFNVYSGGNQSVNPAIPAGAMLTFAAQYVRDAATGKFKVRADTGSGYGSFSSLTANALTAFATQNIQVGGPGLSGTANVLCGLLFDLKGRAGQVTLADMQTEPGFAPINPFEVTDLDLPGPLISKAQSGRVNIRSTQQIGRTWTEHYLLKVGEASAEEFLARMKNYWRNGTIFAKGHVDYPTMDGVGGGVPRVKGANQTGSTLIVDGCPVATAGWLLAGDLFRVQGLPQVLQCAADVNTEGDGRALIQMVVPIFSGGSPSDNAGLTISGVTLDVCILEPPSFPTTSGSGANFGELILKFSEAL